MAQKVVIIGHSYSSRLGIIRSVAQIGCEITVIVMTGVRREGRPSIDKKPIDCYSKYVGRILYCNRKDQHALMALLTEKCQDLHHKVVLIPDGDDVVATIDNNKNILKEHFLFPHIAKEPSEMEYWMDKANQKRLAKEIGLNVADATMIEITDGHYNIPTNIKYPCFPKPLATMNGGKGGMRRCDNANDLAAALDHMIDTRGRNIKVLVEEYKKIETEYALVGFSDGEEVIVPGILQFLRISKAHKGIALQGKVMPVDSTSSPQVGFGELVEKFKQLVLAIGFVGVFDVDFYQSDGIFYFCELNLRYGGSGYAVTKMGVNLPAMMVKSFYGEDISDMKKSVDGEAVYVNERMCLDDWNSGRLPLREYLKYLRTADIQFVADNEDNRPEREYNRVFRKHLLTNSIRRLLAPRGRRPSVGQKKVLLT